MQGPRLRDVEVIRVQADLYAVRDPLRYTEEVLVFPAAVLEVIGLLDGARPAPEVCREFFNRTGVELPEAALESMLEILEADGFLEGERFEERRRGIDRGFAAAAVRPPAHAGSGYETDAETLVKTLEGYFKAAREGASAETPASALRAVIAPHIDMRRGSSCYARSYAEVRRRSAPRTVVLLGIAHAGVQNRYAFTGKDFATPLGTLRTDKRLLKRLAAACSFDPFQDEAAHRCEHSIEFQAVFLRHVFPDAEDLRIVPVLCGPFLPDFYSAGSPGEDPQVSSFIEGLRALVAEAGTGVLLIAGADLCHVGRRFGDSEPFTEAFVDRARAADLAMLETVAGLDAEGFMGFIQRERDSRKVCGTPAIYALLSALRGPGSGKSPALSARVLSHGMAVDREGESAVGFASVEITQSFH